MKYKLRLTLTFYTLLFFTAILNAQGSFWGIEDFQNTFKQALVHQKNTVVQEVQGGYIYGIGDDIDVLTSSDNSGSWKFTLTTYINDWFGTFEVFYAPVIVTNYGNKFRIDFASYPIEKRFMSKILEELQDDKEDMIDEFSDAEVNWSTDESHVYISTVYNYKADDDEDEIKDLLYELLSTLRFNVHAEVSEMRKDMWLDYREELWDTDIDYLSKDDLNILFSLEKYDENDSSVKEGKFELKANGEYNCEIFNHGDSLVFVLWANTPEVSSAEEDLQILEEFQEYVYDEGPPDGAASVYAGWYPGYEERVYMCKAVFNFDKSYTYGDFSDYYYNVKSNYMQYVYDELDIIIDDVLDNW